jgi:Ca2+-binding EF-hand superfamily protein
MKQVAFTIMALSAFVIATSKTVGQPPPGGQRRPPGRFNPVMRLFDADQDGTLSADEIAGAAAKLKEFDKNKDGKRNDEELRGALPFGRGPGGLPGARPPFRPGRGS